MQNYWFRAKRFGWGWAEPLTWQGWLAYLSYAAFLVYRCITVDQQANPSSAGIMAIAPEFVAATAVLLIICYLKGEKPRWRWGGK